MSREEMLLNLLNEAWALLPVKPKYDELNVLFPFEDAVPALEALEAVNPKLGISGFGGTISGMSSLSLIATITDVLCDRRLAATIDDETNTIIGWQWYIEPPEVL